jgi:hypothetical protein
VLVLVDREAEGLAVLAEALVLAERVAAADVVALCRNYAGSARLQLGGTPQVSTSFCAALSSPQLSGAARIAGSRRVCAGRL